jgi:hypothetical protein
VTESDFYCTPTLDIQPEETLKLMVTAFCPVCRVQVFEYLAVNLVDAVAEHLNAAHPRGRAV